MPTYADYAAQRERAAKKVAQDRRDAVRHAGFDLSAQDHHMKSERAHFAVVTASPAFRRGYTRIDWSTPQAASPGK